MSKINPTNKPMKKVTFKFNIFWMYAIIVAFLAGMYFLNNNSNTLSKEVSLDEFNKYVAVDQGISNIVINDDNTAEGTLTDSLATMIFGKNYTDNKANGVKAIVYTNCNQQSMTDQVQNWSKDGTYKGSYNVEQESDLSKILWSIGPLVLLIAFWIFMMRRMSGGGAGGSGIFNVGKSKAQIFDKEGGVKVNFSDVAGLAEAKTEIEEIVEFLRNPKRYTELGGKIPKGALLVGPPGTGKTLLAKAVAGEANVPFFYMSGSDFTEMFVGVGASRVRDLFRQAKEKSPCIVFIDEIDTVGRARGKSPNMGGNDERENTLNQLLTEMDGFGTNSGVIILAATNRADILDKALLRAGRFDRQIYVELPDLNDRVAIFNVHLRKIKIAADVDVDLLARQTPGFSGADIANVCNEAALIAARHNKKEVERQDFINAVDRIIGGLEKRNKITTDEEKRAIAVHEAGHATVSWHLQYANPLIKVTIVPRGKALGAAWYLPEERQITPSQAILDDICSLLAGRAAEELFLGHISTGAANDLERVTKQAYAMVVYYGMSDKLPNISYYDSTGQEYGFNKPFSDDRAKMIDEEVSRIISEQYERAKSILKQYAEGHEQLANILITREVIFTEDVENIFGKRQWASRTDEILAAKSADAKEAEMKEIAENAEVAQERNTKAEELQNSEDEEKSYPANMPPLPQE
ncbi:MAG: ATP-dependent zinc metalloprotease FtsH [Muribaculaceae bacterium]|nr:ATP-dependent zinc metalloprotease FtsH [Muribaculaceae bacterium]